MTSNPTIFADYLKKSVQLGCEAAKCLANGNHAAFSEALNNLESLYAYKYVEGIFLQEAFKKAVQENDNLFVSCNGYFPEIVVSNVPIDDMSGNYYHKAIYRILGGIHQEIISFADCLIIAFNIGVIIYACAKMLIEAPIARTLFDAGVLDVHNYFDKYLLSSEVQTVDANDTYDYSYISDF